jgi:hypothetical protein
MSFKWESRCYQCGRPTNVYFDDDYNVETYTKALFYYIQNPINFMYNVEYLKFYGLKLTRVCAHCFHHKIHYNPSIQRDREMGKRVCILKKSYAKTSEQIENWNRQFDNYLKNSV